MKNFKYLIIVMLMIGFYNQSQAQYVLDGVYQKEQEMRAKHPCF